LSFAGSLPAADARLKPLLSRDKAVEPRRADPGSWLAQEPGSSSAAEERAAYLEFFCDRLENSGVFVNEAIRARGEST